MVEGSIPVRDGHGEADLVIEVEGFYVDERADATLQVSAEDSSVPEPDGGAVSATYSFVSPDGTVRVLEGTLEGLPAGFGAFVRPSSHCADPSGCTLRVSIAVDAAPGMDADVPVALGVDAFGYIDQYDLGPEHIAARLEVAP